MKTNILVVSIFQGSPQAEYNAKVHFQTLLRRSRCSRQSLKDRRKTQLARNLHCHCSFKFSGAKVEFDYSTEKQKKIGRLSSRTIACLNSLKVRDKKDWLKIC